MAIHHYSARGPTRIERYYRVRELAEMTGFSRDSIYNAVKRGELHKTNLNGMKKCWRFSESEVMRWLAECTE